MSVAPADALTPTPGAERRCRVRIDWPRVNGVRIDPVTRRSFVGSVSTFIDCGHSHVVHFCAAHPTVEARSDVGYREILNRGALNVPDGLPVAWAARMFGSATERLAGTDAMGLTAGWGLDRGLRHYLYGSTPETLRQLRIQLEARYPGIQVVGAESPPFRALSEAEVEDAAGRIRAARTDALWVGLGAPKQDLMAFRLRTKGAAPVILCVGAAFDFVAGAKRRAPAWMQRSGLEWAHRLGSEPDRLWKRYLIGNTRFVVGVARDRLTPAGHPGER